MNQTDGHPDPRTNGRTTTATRRRVLSVAGLGGATASLAPVFGTGGTDAEQIELGGETSGWIGRRPAEIEGKTNPTLPLTPGRTYELTWENVDGVPHNVAIYDENEAALVQTEILSEQGATQTVEFEATEAMTEYVCEVHPSTMRAPVDASEAGSTATETPEETPTGTSDGTEQPDKDGDDEADEEPVGPAFEPSVVEEQRGDVATVALHLGGADRAEVVLGSEPVNYLVSVTAVDGDGDGQVTIALDTFVAGRGESGLGAAAEADEVRDYQQETETLSSPLDAAAYPLEAYVDDRLVAVGTLSLEPRETNAAATGVAPRTARPSEFEAFGDQLTGRDRVATGDWAVFDVEASGLSATLDGVEAFADESLGYELTIEETEAFNRRPDEVPLEDVHLVTDPGADRFLAAVDSAPLRVDETYEGTFAITDANPYVPEGERESVSATFTVVGRSATFDVDGEVLEVPPAEASIAGTSTLAPGTSIAVSVRGTGTRPFQKTAQTTVEEDGSWEVTIDFSRIEPGTPFVAQVVDVSDRVEGEVSGEA